MGVARVVVVVVLVLVTFVNVVHMPGLVPVVLVGVALVGEMVVGLGMMLVGIALMLGVHVAGFIAVVFVGITLVDVVFLQPYSYLLKRYSILNYGWVACQAPRAHATENVSICVTLPPKTLWPRGCTGKEQPSH